MCEVVKVKIDFHFISPCTWLGGKMGLQKVSGGRDGGWHRASVIFVGMKNAPLTAAIYEACFMNEFFFELDAQFSPLSLGFFSPFCFV